MKIILEPSNKFQGEGDLDITADIVEDVHDYFVKSYGSEDLKKSFDTTTSPVNTGLHCSAKRALFSQTPVLNRTPREQANVTGKVATQQILMDLGLYICREVVELYNGHIEAQFPTEGGSLFLVTLPLK